MHYQCISGVGARIVGVYINWVERYGVFMFEKFIVAYPPELVKKEPIDVDQMSRFVETELGVSLPREVKSFWDTVGSGYFGSRVLYVFGDGFIVQPRDSFQDWNKKDFWPSVYPAPKDGGPVFFAETCFGDQLGFRWEGTTCVYVLFCIDTFEGFALSKSGSQLFGNLLAEKYALLDEDCFRTAFQHLGPLETGMHYAPIVSPMLGGGSNAGNFCFETPNVHFRTSIATFYAKQSRE